MDIGMCRDGEAGEKMKGFNISQEERWVDKGNKVVMGQRQWTREGLCIKLYSWC